MILRYHLPYHFYFIGLIMLGCSNIVFAQIKKVIIADSIIIYYPDKFDAVQNLPSFALVNEPKELGNASDSWNDKVVFSVVNGKHVASIPLELNTNVYGTGEVTGSLDRNGTVRKLWNTDNYGYETDNALRLYQSHPWVLGVREDGTAFGVLADHTYKQDLVIGSSIQFISEGPAFRVIYIEKKTPQEVIKALGKLIGTIDLPPLWSIGYQQCRFSYYPDSRVKEIADTFRLKKIPCDVIWVDINYMDAFKIFSFHPQHFPKPKELNDYLHNKGYKAIWMIDPGVKVEKGYNVFDSGTKEDVWVKTEKNETFIGKVWPGDCVFPDYTQPKVKQWWGGLYKDFMATGVDGVWNDMNEPCVFNGPDGTMPLSNIHLGGDGLPKGTHARYHNVYGRLMVEASRSGIMALNSTKRPFILTRSNYIGGHRFAATWTGDNCAYYSHMKMSIPMSLNLGLSGQPFSGPDIGGYKYQCTPDLYGHWIAIGAFYPFARTHTDRLNSHQEPWSFGKNIEEVARVAISRRYRLLPYLYTLFQESSKTGMPVMRPVFFADTKDIKIRKEDQAFMLGADVLIVPKWAQDTKLPKGKWRTVSLVGEDSKTDTYQPDILVRPGAIVPLSNVIQSTALYTLDTLTLIVNLDTLGNATGQLYFDEGNGYGYKEGQFAMYKFNAVTKDNKVIITRTKIEGVKELMNALTIVQLYTDKGVVIAQVKGSGGVEVVLP